jgi:hypothetical protein
VTRATIPLRLGWMLAPALVLFALTALCYASPPDQTWIAGLHDDADHDDVVLEVLAACAVPPPAVPHLRAPASRSDAQPAVPRAVRNSLDGIALLDRSPPLA